MQLILPQTQAICQKVWDSQAFPNAPCASINKAEVGSALVARADTGPRAGRAVAASGPYM